MTAPPTLTPHTATELKNKIGQITREVCKQGKHILIERGGLPIMVILPVQDYQQWLEKQRLPE